MLRINRAGFPATINIIGYISRYDRAGSDDGILAYRNARQYDSAGTYPRIAFYDHRACVDIVPQNVALRGGFR